MLVHNIIFKLIIKDIIENDVCNTLKIARISTLFYQIFKPILDDKDSLLSKKIKLITKEISHNQIMFKAAITDYKDIVLLMIEKGANDWDLGMVFAAQGGNKDLIEFFIEKGANDWNEGMKYAALFGNKDLVEFFIEKGADDWNWGMIYAAYGNHKDLVDFFIEKGANDWNNGMYYAAEGGHKDLVEFFREKIYGEKLINS